MEGRPYYKREIGNGVNLSMKIKCTTVQATLMHENIKKR
jgi:hypothetical protein